MFKNAASWTETVVLLLLKVAMMFSAAVAVRSNAHFVFPILQERSEPHVWHIMKLLVQFMTALVEATLCWCGTGMAVGGWLAKVAGIECWP